MAVWCQRTPHETKRNTMPSLFTAQTPSCTVQHFMNEDRYKEQPKKKNQISAVYGKTVLPPAKCVNDKCYNTERPCSRECHDVCLQNRDNPGRFLVPCFFLFFSRPLIVFDAFLFLILFFHTSLPPFFIIYPSAYYTSFPF